MSGTGHFPERYSVARKALAEARRIDEVKDFNDRAIALQVYARQARDPQLISHATEIRLRAERRLGELTAAKPKAKGGDVGGRKSKAGKRVIPAIRPTTLAEEGIDKNLAQRARRAAELSTPDFEARVKKAQRMAVASVEGNRSLISEARRELTEEKKAKRAHRERTLGAKICALPDKRYGVILADPEWSYEVWSRETGKDRSAENHYPTSELGEIAARDVPSIAADDCVLALWCTGAMLEAGLHVMKSWGFSYKAQYVWVKDKAGTGYWNRERHELLLIGTRGQVVPPAMGTQWDSVIEAPRSSHSAKPDAVLFMLESYYPTIPKIELNRRGPARPGWDAWGNEAE